jgi:hypothetical protein
VDGCVWFRKMALVQFILAPIVVEILFGVVVMT